MKKIIVAACLMLSLAFSAEAQRYGIVDTKYILDKIPEYKDAQKSLDEVSEQWQKEIDQKQTELDRMYRNFEAEQVMLSDELKKKGKMSFSCVKKNFGICRDKDSASKATFSRNVRSL